MGTPQAPVVPPPATDSGAARRELEVFSASISHDLQAPLRQISAFAELLAREAGPMLSDTARQHLDDIMGAASHMRALIDALLAFSRAGHADLHTTTVDLHALVGEVVREQLRDEPDRAIDVSVGPLPHVAGDRLLLRQAFANLLANAVKYTRPRARARIEVASTTLAGSDKAVVFVRDNGVGFDMRCASRLFEAFERLHPASEFEGSGVGLSSVRRIVERHGGSVWATGVAGEGATFFVALPDADPDRRAVHPPLTGASR